MVPEDSGRRMNTVAYRAEASKLKKLYPKEFLAFIDGQLVGHGKDSAQLFSEIRRIGIGGDTVSIFYTGSNDIPTTGFVGELCPNCNAPLAPPPAIFCGECGYLSRCTNCMNLMPIDAEFCGECGPTPPDTNRSERIMLPRRSSLSSFRRKMLRPTREWKWRWVGRWRGIRFLFHLYVYNEYRVLWTGG
jgi:hypothetical protein